MSHRLHIDQRPPALHVGITRGREFNAFVLERMQGGPLQIGCVLGQLFFTGSISIARAYVEDLHGRAYVAVVLHGRAYVEDHSQITTKDKRAGLSDVSHVSPFGAPLRVLSEKIEEKFKVCDDRKTGDKESLPTIENGCRYGSHAKFLHDSRTN